MTRLSLSVAALCLATFTLNGCSNRTHDGERWEQIAEAQKSVKNIQPWSEAKSPWASAQYHSGTAW